MAKPYFKVDPFNGGGSVFADTKEPGHPIIFANDAGDPATRTSDVVRAGTATINAPTFTLGPSVEADHGPLFLFAHTWTQVGNIIAGEKRAGREEYVGTLLFARRRDYIQVQLALHTGRRKNTP